jgi:hypothetical protein
MSGDAFAPTADFRCRSDRTAGFAPRRRWPLHSDRFCLDTPSNCGRKRLWCWVLWVIYGKDSGATAELFRTSPRRPRLAVWRSATNSLLRSAIRLHKGSTFAPRVDGV